LIMINIISNGKAVDWKNLLLDIVNLLKSQNKEETLIGLKASLAVFKATNLRMKKKDSLS
jgi:hypothetical protein